MMMMMMIVMVGLKKKKRNGDWGFAEMEKYSFYSPFATHFNSSGAGNIAAIFI